MSLSEILLGYGGREGQIIGTPSLLRLGYGYGVFFGVEKRYALFFQGILSISSGQFFFDVNADLRYKLTTLHLHQNRPTSKLDPISRAKAFGSKELPVFHSLS